MARTAALLVIGIQTKDLFNEKVFNNYAELVRDLKKVNGVTDIISVPSAINLVKQPETEKLIATSMFAEKTLSQAEIDSSKNIFLSLPFYRQLLYNPETNAWMMGITIEKAVINSQKRNVVVNDIRNLAETFAKNNQQEIYLSGLPLIRTELSTRIADEMRWFLLASVVLVCPDTAFIFSLFEFHALVIGSGNNGSDLEHGHHAPVWL